MIFNVTGGGGAGLNFKLITAASVDALPDSAAENTIAVIPDTAINGYAFSATEPGSPTPGMLWIKIGASSTVPFNALKKNNVMVYPLTAQQYIGGAWVSREAYTYQGGKWVEWWDGELYDSGNLYESVTGGWETVPLVYSSDDGGAPTITYNDDSLYIVGGTSGAAILANKIDLTEYSTLNFEGVMYAAANPSIRVQLCIWSDLGAKYNDNVVASAKGTTDTGQTLDISGLSGEYVIGFYLYGTSTTVTVKKMKME